MKLRNKKTGEIKEWTFSEWLGHITNPNNEAEYECNLVEFMKRTNNFCEEWEEYEEPKSWWYIDCNGEVFRGENADKEHTEEHKLIGNYYNSSREAEKAVEKLKAWKRLKDKGLEFAGWGCKTPDGTFLIMAKAESCDEVVDDLDLLFGGEE